LGHRCAHRRRGRTIAIDPHWLIENGPHPCTSDMPGDCWGWRLVLPSGDESRGLAVIVTAQVRLDDAADLARQALDTKGRSIAEAIGFEVDPPRYIARGLVGWRRRSLTRTCSKHPCPAESGHSWSRRSGLAVSATTSGSNQPLRLYGFANSARPGDVLAAFAVAACRTVAVGGSQGAQRDSREAELPVPD